MANRQILPIREFCDEHNLVLERVYVDEAKVSSDSEKRIQYNQMMTDLMRRFPQIRNLDKRKKIMLTTQLYSTPSGYDHFFRNRIYIGILDYGGMTLENFVEPLIPREWFDIVQQKREAFAAKRRKQQADPMHEPRRLGSRHLLSGLVFCGAVPDHEHPMNADTVPPKGKKPRWDHYLCTVMKNTRSQRCQAPRIGAAALDHAVIDRLLTDILTVAHLRPIADELGKAVHDRNREVEARIMGVEGRLKEVKRSIQTLLDALERAGFSPNIQARLREREQEERRLLAELINLQSLLVAPRDIPKVTDQQIEDWIESVRTALTGTDVEEARRVIRQFVAKIVIKEKAGTLYYTFPLSALSRLHPVIPSGFQTATCFIFAA